MAKDPAFLFYPGDWLGGTIGMSFEEKGAYMELLMMQFTRGHMTKDMIGQTVGQIWVKLQDKFIQDDNGLWYNERLDVEKEKRKNFVSSRKNNKEGKNQHNNGGGHMTSHMENRNVNSIGIKGVQGDFYETKKEAYDEITKNYKDVQPAISLLSNRGWPSVKDQDIGFLLYHFLEKNEDCTEKPKKDVRQHFKNWLNKTDLNELTKLSISVRARLDRQRQPS